MAQCSTLEDMHISDAPSSNRAGSQGRAPRSSCQKQVVFMYVFLCIFSRSGLSAVVYAATKDLLNLINKV